MFFHWGSLLTEWAPYINFSHEYSPLNYPILQVTHQIEYITAIVARSPMKQYMYEKNKGIIDEPLIELVLERLSEQYFHDADRVAGLLMQGYFRKGYN